MTLCRDEYCPFKDDCKRYRRDKTAHYFYKSPKLAIDRDSEGNLIYACEMYISKGHVAPEGVK